VSSSCGGGGSGGTVEKGLRYFSMPANLPRTLILSPFLSSFTGMEASTLLPGIVMYCMM
jgi:hypothetical protein